MFKTRFFITKKTPENEDCVDYVLRSIDKKYKGQVENNTLREIIDYIKKNNLKVAIVSNCIFTMVLSISSFQGPDVINVDGMNYRPLKNIKYSLCYLHGNKKRKYDYYIIFDCVSEHCEYNNILEIRNIYVSITRDFYTYKDGKMKKLIGAEQQNWHSSIIHNIAKKKLYNIKMFNTRFLITKKTPDGEDCVNYVLRNIHKKYKGEVRNNTLKEMIDYITEKNLNVAIISNGIAVKPLQLSAFRDQDVIKINGIRYKPLKNTKYFLNYLHGDEKKKYDYYIIFDCVSEHCEYNDKLELRDIYVSLRKTFYTYQDGKMNDLIGVLKNCENNKEQKITKKIYGF